MFAPVLAWVGCAGGYWKSLRPRLDAGVVCPWDGTILELRGGVYRRAKVSVPCIVCDGTRRPRPDDPANGCASQGGHPAVRLTCDRNPAHVSILDHTQLTGE